MDGVVCSVDHSAVFIADVHPNQLGGAAVQLEGIFVLGGKGDLGGGTGGAAGKLGHRFAVQIGHRFQGAFTGGVGREIEGEGGMGQMFGAHISAAGGCGHSGGVAGVAVGGPHLGVGGLFANRHAVYKQLHLVTVAEDANLVGRAISPGIGDKDHGAALQAVLAQIQVGIGLALEEVSAELGDTGHVHHAAEGELVLVEAGVVGVIPISGGAVPALTAVEGEGGLDIVALDQHTLVAALGVGVVLGLAGDAGGGVEAAEVPVAVLADDDRLFAVLGSISNHVGLGGAHANIKDVPELPAAGVGLGVAHLGVLLLHQVVHILGPGGSKTAFIQTGLPGHHGTVVAIDPDLVPHLLIGIVFEGVGVRKVLPAGQTVQHGHAVPVAGLIEGGIVGIVAHADEVEAVFPQPLDLGKDGVVALGVAHHVALGVEVDAHQLHPLIVDVAAVSLPLHLANAVGGLHCVFDRAVHEEGGADGVEFRGVYRPQPGIGDGQVLLEGIFFIVGYGLGVFRFGHHRGAVLVNNLGAEGDGGVAAAEVFHLGFGVDGGALLGDDRRREEDAAAGHGVGLDGVGDVDGAGDGHIDVTVQAAEILEVGVGLAGGKGGVGPGVQPDSQHIFPVKFDFIGNVEGKLGVTALVDAQFLAVEPHGGFLHGALKGQDDLLAFHGRIHGEVTAVPVDPQIFMEVVFGGVLDGAVGGVDIQPLAVVGFRGLGVGPLAGIEPPVIIKADDRAAGIIGTGGGNRRSCQRKETQCHCSCQKEGQGAF